MAAGDDWLFRPLMRGLFMYESLKDGSIGIYDICRMNEALDVQAENERRMRD